MFMYARSKKAMDRFEQAFWSGQSIEELYRALSAKPTQSMAALFVAAMREWKRSFESQSKSFAGLQMRIEKVMNVTIMREIDRLERRLLVLATVGLQPHFEETGDFIHDWYRHAIYFSVFLYGYWLGNDAPLWGELVRLRRRSLGVALAVFAVYLPLTRLLPDDGPFWHTALIYTLRNFYIWAALCAILGWSHAHLNRPFRWLPWANEAGYPWDVLPRGLIGLIAYWLLPLQLGPWIEPALVLAGTVLGCWALHAWVIRGNRWLRPCFGLKPLAGTPVVRRSPAPLRVG